MHHPLHLHPYSVGGVGEKQIQGPRGESLAPRPVILRYEILKGVNWFQFGNDGEVSDEGGAIGVGEDEAEH